MLQEGTASPQSLAADVETLTSLCREVLPCVQKCLAESVAADGSGTTKEKKTTPTKKGKKSKT